MDIQKQQKQNYKYAVVFIGESFREGLQGSRKIGSDEGIKDQELATQSQMKWLSTQKLKFDHDVDIFFSTTECNQELNNKLIDWYNGLGSLKFYSVLSPEYSSYSNHFQFASKLVKMQVEKGSTYDFVFILRIDLILKDQFIEVFNKNLTNMTSMVMFPSICFTLNNSHVCKTSPRVNDTMISIPGKFVNVFLEDKLILRHESWNLFVNTPDLNISNSDIGFLLNTFHDSDPYKDWNPLYRFGGRPESLIHYNQGLLLNYEQLQNTLASPINFIIPIGGKGERFSKAGFKTPKPLINVIDKPMIFYVLDQLVKLPLPQNKKNIIIVYDDESISDLPKMMQSRYDAMISYVPLNGMKTRGAIETVLQTEPLLKKQNAMNHPTLLLDCDTHYTCWDQIFCGLLSSSFIGVNSVFYFEEQENIHPPPYSYIAYDDIKSNLPQIVNIAEKQRISKCANTGAYLFYNASELFHYGKVVIDKDIRFKNEFYTSVVINHMIEFSESIFIANKLPYDNVISLGTPEQLESYIDKCKACLFDMDGTLVITDHIYYKVWEKIMTSFHLNITKEIYEKYIRGNDDNYVIKALSLSINVKVLSELKDNLFIEMINEIDLVPNSLNYLSECYRHGHKVCIVTNCNRKVAESIIQYLNINQFIDYLVIGSECSRPKPYPDPYERALKVLNMDTDKAVIFEDSPSGLKSAEGVMPKSIIHIGGPNHKDFSTVPSIEDIFKSEEMITSGDQLKPSKISHRLKKYISALFKCNFQEIVMNDTKLKGGYIADVIQFSVGTKKYVLKIKSTDPTNKLYEMADKLDLYNREAYFYESMSKYVALNSPAFYGVLRDNQMNPIGIVLEDISGPGMTINLDLNIEPIETSLSIIDYMTSMHSDFWNATDSFYYLKKHNCSNFNWVSFIRNKWPSFKDKWSSVLSTMQMQIAESIVNRFDDIQEHLSSEPLTLCHGDIKSPNIFYKSISISKDKTPTYDPWFIDWQYVAKGKGVQDLVFFLIESFTTENIVKYDTLFSEYYYLKLLENNKQIQQTYTPQQFAKDKINAVCYFPFFVAIWFGTTDKEDLIDVNFPFFFITKYFTYLQHVFKNE